MGMLEAVLYSVGVAFTAACIVYAVGTLIFHADERIRDDVNRLKACEIELAHVRSMYEHAREENDFLRSELEAQKRVVSSFVRHPAFAMAQVQAEGRPVRPSLRRRERDAVTASPSKGGDDV